MRNEGDDTRDRSAAVYCAFVVLALLVAYPLSIGPAAWVLNHFQNRDSLVWLWASVYATLIWLAEHSEEFGKLANWYLSWW